ncbi:MAG: two-component system, OmpR family, operon response regulator KdpE [Frankiaceae bacterium]|jgi:two-component system KDP operon response regulator KdpE|nr:two-component system, OmpR family, operon response regulator KdpE [Frankiaceae bacterium]
MTRVLVVDDEAALLRALTINLRARSYDVVTAATGTEALRAAAARPPDVVILDLGLPDMDGVDVITGLRGWTAVPIVVLSARESEREKVAALDAGADDYVVKPFGMDEFLARLRAAIRRGAPAGEQASVVAGDLTIDLAAKAVLRADRRVALTPTEWHVLEVLVRHRNRTVEHRALLQEVWGPAYVEQPNYLRVYVAALRRKLESDPARPRHLLTDVGIGYRWFAPDKD